MLLFLSIKLSSSFYFAATSSFHYSQFFPIIYFANQAFFLYLSRFRTLSVSLTPAMNLCRGQGAPAPLIASFAQAFSIIPAAIYSCIPQLQWVYCSGVRRFLYAPCTAVCFLIADKDKGIIAFWNCHHMSKIYLLWNCNIFWVKMESDRLKNETNQKNV